MLFITRALFLFSFYLAARPAIAATQSLDRERAIEVFQSGEKREIEKFLADTFGAFYFAGKRKILDQFVSSLSVKELETFSSDAIAAIVIFSNEKKYFRFQKNEFAFEKLKMNESAKQRIREAATHGKMGRILEKLEKNRHYIVMRRHVLAHATDNVLLLSAKNARRAGLVLSVLNAATWMLIPEYGFHVLLGSLAPGAYFFANWVSDPEVMIKDRGVLMAELNTFEKYALDHGFQISPNVKAEIALAIEGKNQVFGMMRRDGLGNLLPQDGDRRNPLFLDLSESDRERASAHSEDSRDVLDFGQAQFSFRALLQDQLWTIEQIEEELVVAGHAEGLDLLETGDNGLLISQSQLDAISKKGFWFKIPDFSVSVFFFWEEGREFKVSHESSLEIWDRPYVDSRPTIVFPEGRIADELVDSPKAILGHLNRLRKQRKPGDQSHCESITLRSS